MKYLLIFLMVGIGTAKAQAINSQQRKPTVIYCLASVDHKHHFNSLEKCNQPGCGAICDCGTKREYKTNKIVVPKKK